MTIKPDPSYHFLSRHSPNRGRLLAALAVLLSTVASLPTSMAQSGDPVEARVPWALAVEFAQDQDPTPVTSDDRPPIREPYHQYFPLCDVDGDGHDDYGSVTTGDSVFRPPGSSTPVVEVFNASGTGQLWQRSDLQFLTPGLMPWVEPTFLGVFGYRLRMVAFDGWTRLLPQPLDSHVGMVTAVPGEAADRPCPLAQYGFGHGRRQPSVSDPACLVGVLCPATWTATLRLLDAASGSALWTKQWDIVQDSVGVHDVPVDLFAAATPQGPRLYLLSTDFFKLPTEEDSDDPYTLDRVRMFDASTGDQLWQRDIPFAPSQVTRRAYNATRITAVTDLDGDGMPEVVLDKQLVARDQDPRPGDDKPAPGVAMDALDGKDGRIRWSTVIIEDGDFGTKGDGVRLDNEEECERLYSTHPQVVSDLFGDSHPDPVALYYTIRGTCDGRTRADSRDEHGAPTAGPSFAATDSTAADVASLNDVFLVHVVPLLGANGSKQWDSSLQGVGFVASTTPPGASGSQATLVLGTADPPTERPPGARFPPKDIRLTGLDPREEGKPLWSYRQPFGLENYLTYHFALQQFLSNLAPHDWTGDGWRDVLTPSQYQNPIGLNQVLLSTAKQTFRVLDGQSGKTHRDFTLWGSTGVPIACPGAESFLNVVVGHPRRLDLIRIDVNARTMPWRVPFWFDPRLYPTTIGVDLTFLYTICNEGSDSRTFFAAGLGTFTYYRGRGAETFPEVGYIEPGGELVWIRPELMRLFGLRPQDAVLRMLDAPEPPEGLEQFSHDVVSLTSLAVVSATIGVGSGRWRRRGPRKGGKA